MAESGAPARIGILGASRFAPLILVKPARGNAEVVAAAVASRDVSRARALAAKLEPLPPNTASRGRTTVTRR
jgi:predicted dehydrogenase